MMSEEPIPEKIKLLNISIGSARSAATLTKESNYVLNYKREDDTQPAVSLLLPPTQMVYDDGELFPSMDMNLPEGFLLHRIMERFPKRKLNKMHLLAMMGDNAIGRVGYFLASEQATTSATQRNVMDRASLLKMPLTPDLFAQLVSAYLTKGIGISGIQPKIMVPTKTSLPIPNLIVKTAGEDFPGLACNEYLCLSAAQRANINVPGFELSDDGQLLVIDRFDIAANGHRLGFEDMAALMGLRVNDRLDNRKYQGSYEFMAQTIEAFSSQPAKDLNAFFEQLALTIMVRNGDGHLKNFGMLYFSPGHEDVRLSPLYDVVTTSIYKYERLDGVETVDRTMALKLRRGKHSNKTYPTTAELLDFGRSVCRVSQPQQVLNRIGQAMTETLAQSRTDPRISSQLVTDMGGQWRYGFAMTSG
jgi:serine/threonine-protein kinase HipA